MKLNKLSALCALACVALSGQAMAATAITGATTDGTPFTGHAAIIKNANDNGRVIYISGASAVQKGFTSIVSSLISGTPIWFNNTSGTANDFQAVAGPLATATTNWPVGTNVILMYRVKGGSAFGVDPVARNTAIEALDVNTTANACTSGTGAALTPYQCTTTLASRTPDAGVSDVAPALFVSPTNTEGETAAASLSADELALLTPTPIYGIAFGVPVTANVKTTVANGATLPALNKAAISAIMSGNVGTWNQVDSKMAADDIVICRRTPGSGTQAVFNMYFGNYPCDTVSANNAPANRDSSFADGDVPGTIWNNGANTFTVPTANTGGLIVIENSSSGNVRDCLNAAATATAANPVSYLTSDRDGVAVTVTFNGPKKAIGVLSMDSLSSSTTSSNWQFRSLDGAGTITQASSSVAPVTSGTGKFPTVTSYTDGTWDMQGWVSFNVPARTTGEKLEVLNTFLAKAQDPAVLNSISALKYVTAAMPGTADPTATGLVLRSGYLSGNQCAPYNRNN
jgi:ABC-type phosphate transport system substrate-binding protein